MMVICPPSHTFPEYLAIQEEARKTTASSKVKNLISNIESIQYSLLHLMGAVVRTHASTLVASLMRIKNSRHYLSL